MNRSASPLLLFSILLFAASLAACTPASVPPATARQSAFPATLITPVVTTQAPTPTEMPPTAVPSPLPTGTPLPASPTPLTVPYDVPKPGTVVMDFVALACRARWANGARDLPCPGDKDDQADSCLPDGFIAPADQAIAEGDIPLEAPVLIGLPGQSGAGHGAGLFGIYPPLYIQPGDAFHATLAGQEGASCDVEFALEYTDAAGKIHHDTGWSMRHQYGGGPVLMRVDLSPLAGQTVQLVLVVHAQGTPEDDWVLMVSPYVDRQGP